VLFGSTLQCWAKAYIGRIVLGHLFGLGIFVVFDVISYLDMEDF
jgi:hypothetical protein